MNTAEKLPIGDLNKWMSTIKGDLITFYRLRNDEYAENPMDDYGNGRIVSFSSRHINFEHPDKFTDDEGNLKLPENALPLSYFEHGNCHWMIAGEPTVPGVEFQWDGVRFAGLWIPDEDVMKNINYKGVLKGKELKDALIEYAKGIVDVYTDWCNGEVYSYQVVSYKLLRDEDGDIIEEYEHYSDTDKDIINEDSCGGIIGLNCAEDALREAV